MGGGVSTNHKSSNRIELSWFSHVLTFLKFLVFWPDPIHQPTHGWEILHRFQIFKRNWNILISSSVIKFLLIPQVPPWVGVWGVSHAHMHACTHTHTCMLNMINMLNMDASMSAAICNFYTCACMHVCACGDTPMPPDVPRHPPLTCPPPQSCREPKTPKFSKSWTNWDNSIVWRFFTSEHSWTHIDYNWSPQKPPHPPAPPPTAEETQIRRITITLERIEIIQFCLKIWDPWTLLHTYRLGLMCRWGVSYPKWHFCFWPKKVFLWPSNKIFSCSCTGSH